MYNGHRIGENIQNVKLTHRSTNTRKHRFPTYSYDEPSSPRSVSKWQAKTDYRINEDRKEILSYFVSI